MKMTHRAAINISSSLSTPPFRIYRISIWPTNEEPGHGFSPYPVVAILSRVFIPVISRSDLFPAPPPDLETAREEGWEIEGSEQVTSYVIQDSDYGLVGSEDDLLDTESDYWCTLFCPWPYDEERDAIAIREEVIKRLDSAKEHWAFRSELRQKRLAKLA